MRGNWWRRGLVLAMASLLTVAVARAQTAPPGDVHREAVDASRYPWSAIGKLYNETGGACTAVIISRDKALTAAHCIFNYRTRRFIPPAALHFLAGYHIGQFSAHARVASYDMGPGFDPLRYDQTSSADWAVLTLTELLPANIAPLKLSEHLSPWGTKAVIAGYPQDRAFALTADGDCELHESIEGGRLLLHTCRGIAGYSGAPILVSSAENKIEIAGIHIASFQSSGGQNVLAIPAYIIQRALMEEDDRGPPGLYAVNNMAGDVHGPNALA